MWTLNRCNVCHAYRLSMLTFASSHQVRQAKSCKYQYVSTFTYIILYFIIKNNKILPLNSIKSTKATKIKDLSAHFRPRFSLVFIVLHEICRKARQCSVTCSVPARWQVVHLKKKKKKAIVLKEVSSIFFMLVSRAV